MSERLWPVNLVQDKAVDAGKVIIPVHIKYSYRRRAPIIKGYRDNWMLEVVAEKASEWVEAPEFSVVELENVTVHGPGVLTLHDEILIVDSLRNCQHDADIGSINCDWVHNSFLLNGYEPKVLLKGKYIHLAMQWDGNYGHWLIEVLPRLIILMRVFDISEYSVVLCGQHGGMRRVYLDALSFLGIAEHRVLFTNYDTYHFERLIYPTPITIQPWVKSPAVIEALEHLQRISPPHIDVDQPEFIFIRRADGARRSMLNQDEIIPEMEARGFAIINPSKMSLSEQIHSFSKAKIVCGVLGAEFTNTVFSPSGVTIFALTPERMQDDFFWDLVSQKCGQYVSLHCPILSDDDDMNSDIRVDIQSAMDILDRIISTTRRPTLIAE